MCADMPIAEGLALRLHASIVSRYSGSASSYLPRVCSSSLGFTLHTSRKKLLVSTLYIPYSQRVPQSQTADDVPPVCVSRPPPLQHPAALYFRLI